MYAYIYLCWLVLPLKPTRCTLLLTLNRYSLPISLDAFFDLPSPLVESQCRTVTGSRACSVTAPLQWNPNYQCLSTAGALSVPLRNASSELINPGT